MSTDQEYYARRSQQERDTANRCDDRGSRRIHAELADRYAEKAREDVSSHVPAQAF